MAGYLMGLFECVKYFWCHYICSAILREEVKYVHTDTDLMIMEKAARGRKNIVLGYVLSLGTQGRKGGLRSQEGHVELNRGGTGSGGFQYVGLIDVNK